jgi:hypothetical protein
MINSEEPTTKVGSPVKLPESVNKLERTVAPLLASTPLSSLEKGLTNGESLDLK